MKFKISALLFMSFYSISLLPANIDALITNAQDKLIALEQSIKDLDAREKQPQAPVDLLRTLLATQRGAQAMQKTTITVLNDLKACLDKTLLQERFKIMDTIQAINQHIASDTQYKTLLKDAQSKTKDPVALGMIEAQLLVFEEKMNIESQLVQYLTQLGQCFAQQAQTKILLQRDVAAQYPALPSFISLDDYDWTAQTPKIVENIVYAIANISNDFNNLSAKKFREYATALKAAGDFLNAQKSALDDKKYGELKELLDKAQQKYITNH